MQFLTWATELITMEMVRAGVHKTSVLSVITNFLSLLEPVDVKD
jgi:hypothetical protein